MKVLAVLSATALGVTLLAGIMSAPDSTWPSKHHDHDRRPVEGALTLTNATPPP